MVDILSILLLIKFVLHKNLYKMINLRDIISQRKIYNKDKQRYKMRKNNPLIKLIVGFLPIVIILVIISCDSKDEPITEQSKTQELAPEQAMVQNSIITNNKIITEITPAEEQVQTDSKFKKKKNKDIIPDIKGSIPTKVLKTTMPAKFRDYESSRPSTTKSEEDGMVITIAKGQYRKEDGTTITIDVTDFSPKKLVPKPEIYDTPPHIVNFKTKSYKYEHGKGFITWNFVKKMGWINILFEDRYNVKIRIFGESADEQLMQDVLKAMDITKLKTKKL